MLCRGPKSAYDTKMNEIIVWANTISDYERMVLILLALSLAWALEALVPLFEFGYAKVQHILKNLVFVVTTAMVTLLLAFVAYGLIGIGEHQTGILRLLDLPVWLEMVCALLVLDFFGQYFIHVCLHRFKWLWKLHLVHHSDTYVDASTGTRHHPGDMFVREILIFCVIVIFGIAAHWYVLYRVITPFFAYFTHANIALPDWLDRALIWVIVTPNMHKFHHHYQRPWTNTNYGNILSIWDRVFGTFVYDDVKQIRYGVDTIEDGHTNDLKYQFQLPFNSSIKTDY